MNQYQQYFETFPFQLALDMSFDRLMKHVDQITSGKYPNPRTGLLDRAWYVDEFVSSTPFLRPPNNAYPFMLIEPEDFSWMDSLPQPKRFHWDIFWIWVIGAIVWVLAASGLLSILYYFT